MSRRTVSMKAEQSCKNCRHFHQYYVKNPYGGFMPCNAGNCIMPGMKMVKCNQICERFEKRGPESEDWLVLVEEEML